MPDTLASRKRRIMRSGRRVPESEYETGVESPSNQICNSLDDSPRLNVGPGSGCSGSRATIGWASNAGFEKYVTKQ
ncbi:hypothetical protein [Nitrobacter sp.]|uniref:hypothetical protein n=1 Tax=Nitrobacter sp. TaxID=29420 RepID=UPI00399D5CC4